MKPDFTKIAVNRQVDAMGGNMFEVGLLNPNHVNQETGEIEERMIIKQWSKQTLLQDETIGFLKHANMKGRHIYIRPAGEHNLSLVDDLSKEGIDRMKKTGLQPAVVVETSPQNYQAWVKHGKSLPPDLSTEASRVLCKELGGDPGSADWRHFGRLAGFTNRKIKYQNENGMFPFCRLAEDKGVTYERRDEVIEKAQGAIQLKREEEVRIRKSWEQSARQRPTGKLKSIDDFRTDPRYGGDHTRVDLAYATYAVSRGVDPAEVEKTIASRDLSHKGNTSRQADYVTRTVKKGMETVRKTRDAALSGLSR